MIKKMKELNEKLKVAAKAYYSEGNEIMSNAEYDKLYDELLDLERKTGTILSDSVTQKVGYEIVSSLPKVKHPVKMLSLDKTKDRTALKEWLGNQAGFLSWKLDGLTVVLTYDNGKLVQAVTRGNGEIGEDITSNAMHFSGIPLCISAKDKKVIRGEALIAYSDFERINACSEEEYKNPRNLCAGTVRQLNSKFVTERNVQFYAFNYVSGTSQNSFFQRIKELQDMGFQTVQGRLVDTSNVISAVDEFENTIIENDFPSDGLVLMLDDIAYGESLGVTSKFPRNGIAFKWADEMADTRLKDVEWSPSRTGLINPVAIFDTVELEGTEVSRASIHNVSIFRKLQLGVGDTISVYKANMIIPQVYDNKTCSNTLSIPNKCPCCSGEAVISISDDGVETLKCINPDCPEKHIGKYEHFVDREAMNIVGISTATIEEFVGRGYIRQFADLYHLDDYKDEIIQLEGFGEKSYEKMSEAINESRKTELSRLLYALGIPNIGRSASRIICSACQTTDDLKKLSYNELVSMEGIGDTLASDYVLYFSDNERIAEFDALVSELLVAAPEEIAESNITGKIFVITGSVNIWKNRNELKAYIESKGGKVASAVSSKTDYLINNDVLSNSSKNKNAKSLGIPIISEKEFETLSK